MKAKLGALFLLGTFLWVPLSPVTTLAQEKAHAGTNAEQAYDSERARAASGGTAEAGGATGLSAMAIAGIAVGLAALTAVVVADSSEEEDGVEVTAEPVTGN